MICFSSRYRLRLVVKEGQPGARLGWLHLTPQVTTLTPDGTYHTSTAILLWSRIDWDKRDRIQESLVSRTSINGVLLLLLYSNRMTWLRNAKAGRKKKDHSWCLPYSAIKRIFVFFCCAQSCDISTQHKHIYTYDSVFLYLSTTTAFVCVLLSFFRSEPRWR